MFPITITIDPIHLIFGSLILVLFVLLYALAYNFASKYSELRYIVNHLRHDYEQLRELYGDQCVTIRHLERWLVRRVGDLFTCTCGHHLAFDDPYCSVCGEENVMADLSSEEQIPACTDADHQESIVFWKKHNLLHLNRFCTLCGEQLFKAPEPPNDPPSEAPSAPVN